MLGTPSRTPSQFSNDVEVFARKVFVGGLPIDVTEEEIWQTFSVFGNVLVDWPRRPDGTSARDEESGRGCEANFLSSLALAFPVLFVSARSMTGYVFLVFEEESSVQYLVSECHKEDDRYYLFVSSPTMRDKPVQVRPWRLADMDFISNPRTVMDPRRTVFIGGVPRPTRASELAECLERLYGPVCYVGIDIDPELKYPKGAARVTFVTTQAFIAAINGRFVHVHHGDSQKRVSSVQARLHLRGIRFRVNCGIRHLCRIRERLSNSPSRYRHKASSPVNLSCHSSPLLIPLCPTCLGPC
ncbi:hypothetical protein COOONC_01977 [Cooperia oncophora]